MSKFQTNQKIAERLKELADQLSNSKLQEHELSEFETLARELYERAVVLNYKAKEAKVYENGSEPKDDSSSQTEEQPTEKETVEQAIESEDNGSQKMEEESSGEIQFDFSSEAESEPTNMESEPTKTVESEGLQEEEANSPTTEQDPAENVEEDTTATEKIESTSTSEGSKELNEAFEDDKVQSFYEQFEKVHNASLGDRLGAAKLNTLKGAIGLNDKLQFISELFNGDSEAFNSSIDTLDKQDSNENARKLLSQIASQQSWDEENPLVEEFARLIERRYVEE